ncbi:hypothetical protein E3P77_03943 [Wallemia ichthyophaga]|uniref:Cytochrome c oxidase polypeptide II n=1 Tax=Wallemia ichthyophaga TaxID=245174 RepID=A0A4T0EVB5_WALIC|nr:hypothetical protein E3P98_03813 [Wallemia ichthyophaga]TIB01583.1 hypothetical protein E3P96_02349 [Wallemia ichthyophaga]TIB29174.1 hypothetical protein E3P84_03808 [Wallemia ichthyophaga]TIB37414.1 hypothetical protein E3P86_02172 [Wallemia ichthyophaga]TIB38801.1 hypothetical protein E3P83_03814 [Wallemia ichthyophaga]
MLHYVFELTVNVQRFDGKPVLYVPAKQLPKFYALVKPYILPEFAYKFRHQVNGAQWYWSYEYSDYLNEEGESLEFDSYMVPESDLELGQLRLLDVDAPVVVPVDTHIRFIVTANDVIHDFAVPSLGLKIDATPG